jgi:hypothetical protein
VSEGSNGAISLPLNDKHNRPEDIRVMKLDKNAVSGLHAHKDAPRWSGKRGKLLRHACPSLKQAWLDQQLVSVIRKLASMGAFPHSMRTAPNSKVAFP